MGLEDLDRDQVALADGKAAHLGELTRIDGVRVPAGVCVTTDAFRRVLADAISGSLVRLGERDRYAVRSSATAEDLPRPRSRDSTTRSWTWSGLIRDGQRIRVGGTS